MIVDTLHGAAGEGQAKPENMTDASILDAVPLPVTS